MDIHARLIETIKIENTLGEGVLWHTHEQAVWWTDIQECRLYKYHLPTGQIEVHTTPERLCSFGFTGNDRQLIAAFASGLAVYDYQTQKTHWISKYRTIDSGIRFNDGRVDRQGRFWTGTMIEDENCLSWNDKLACKSASLYSIDKSHHLRHHESGITISNGICWSMDSRYFYFADSPKRQIYQYDFDARDGVLTNRRLFTETEPGIFPDGADIDTDGHLWSAQWGGHRIVRYTPAGDVDFILEMPVEQPTCIAFGGENLDLLFVTSARAGLSQQKLRNQPDAGNLFIYQLNVKGLPAHHFAGSTRYAACYRNK